MIRSIVSMINKRNFSVLNEFAYKQVPLEKESHSEKPKPHEVAEAEEQELNKDHWKEKDNKGEYDVEKMKWTTSIS